MPKATEQWWKSQSKEMLRCWGYELRQGERDFLTRMAYATNEASHHDKRTIHFLYGLFLQRERETV